MLSPSSALRPLTRGSRRRLVAASGHPRVAILEDGRAGDREGLIQAIHRRSSEVDVRLLLDDGVAALAVLSCHDADWLDVRKGDIVFVALSA